MAAINVWGKIPETETTTEPYTEVIKGSKEHYADFPLTGLKGYT